jgi:hypothetical protein
MILLSALLFLVPVAKADDVFLIACGEGKVKSQKDAYVALREEEDSLMEFYLNGKALNSEDYDIASDEGAWIVTLPPKDGEPLKKFLFLESKKTVQEYHVKKGKEKRVGTSLPCHWQD